MIFFRFAFPSRVLRCLCTIGFLTLGPAAIAQEQPAHDTVNSGAATPASVAPEADSNADVSGIAEPPPSADATSTSKAAPKRLFGVIPNNRADQTEEIYKPLTAAEKFHIARSDSFDWPNYFLLAGFALESQVAAGGFSHNGGMTGFGEFYARSLGDQILGSYITEAIFPSLLHEDPRYFRLGTGTVRHRAAYAASRIFVTRRDSGRNGLNISELAGNASFVALATTYYTNERSAPLGAERFGLQLGNDVVTNVLTEFWPDIKHRLRFLRWHPPLP